jgi:ADP-heptose:LPS heptosyltransferase
MAFQKILAIKLRSMGDTVLMAAPLIELHQAYPQSEIHTLVPRSWAPLLEGIPGIAKIWTYERGKNTIQRAQAMASLTLQLRREKYDGVINFHASPSSATLAFATGAKVRAIHFHGHQDKNKYSTVEIPGKGTIKPIIERDMDTLRALGIHVPAGRTPQIFIQTSEIQEAARLLQKLGLTSPILGMSLGASRRTKCWPVERFAGLALEWIRDQGGSVIAIAGPLEVNETHGFLKSIDDLLAAEVADPKSRAEIRARICTMNELSVRQLGAVLSHLSVLAGNDSGPKHVAIAVDTPTVTLFGPEDPFEWHPYSRERHPYHFIENLKCRKDAASGMPAWCGIPECITEEHQCMTKIGTDAVLRSCVRVHKICP